MKARVLKRRYARRARSLLAVLIVMVMTMASFPMITAMDNVEPPEEPVVEQPVGEPLPEEETEEAEEAEEAKEAEETEEAEEAEDAEEAEEAEDSEEAEDAEEEADEDAAIFDGIVGGIGGISGITGIIGIVGDEGDEVDEEAACECGECSDCLIDEELEEATETVTGKTLKKLLDIAEEEEEIIPCECCDEGCECIDCDGTECGCCAGFALFATGWYTFGNLWDDFELEQPDWVKVTGVSIYIESTGSFDGQFGYQSELGQNNIYSEIKGDNNQWMSGGNTVNVEVLVSGQSYLITHKDTTPYFTGASDYAQFWSNTWDETKFDVVGGEVFDSAGNVLASFGDVPTLPTCDGDIEITSFTANGGTASPPNFTVSAPYGESGAIFKVDLPSGRTLGSYESLSLDFTGIEGDCGWKSPRLYVTSSAPTGWMENQPYIELSIGDPSEKTSLTFYINDNYKNNDGPITDTSSILGLTGTVYLTFSLHCAVTGDHITGETATTQFKLENIVLNCNGGCITPPCTHVWSATGADAGKHKCTLCDAQQDCANFTPNANGTQHNCGVCNKPYAHTYAANGICTVCGALDPNHVVPTLPADAFDLGVMDFNNNANQRGWNIGGAVFDAFKESEYFVFHVEASALSAWGGMGGLTIVLNGPSWTETRVLEDDWTNASDLLKYSWIKLVDNEYVFTIELPSLNGYSAFIANGGWQLVIAYYANTELFNSITKTYLLPPPPGACTEHVWSSAGADAGRHKCTICDRQEDCLDFKAGATGKHNCTVCDKPYDCTWRSDGTCAVCGQKDPNHDDTVYEATIINLGKVNAQNNNTQQGWAISGDNIDNLAKATYFVFTLPVSSVETRGGVGGVQFIFNTNSGGWHQSDAAPGWTGVSNILNMASSITTVTEEGGLYHFAVDLKITNDYSTFIGQEGKLLLGYYDDEFPTFFSVVSAYLIIYEGDAPPPPCRHNWNTNHDCTICGITHPSGREHTYNTIDVCTICGYVNPETTNLCALQGHLYAPAGSDNGRWGHNCARNCGALDWEDHSLVGGRCTKCGYDGLVACYAGNHLYQPTGGDNGRWGHNCGRHCGMMDWENHIFDSNGVCTKCGYRLSAEDFEEMLAAEEEGEDEEELMEEDNREVGGITTEGVVVDENVFKDLLERAIAEGRNPVINVADLIAETGGSIITAEMFLLIKELGVDVVVELPSGFSYTIIASSISDNVGAFDLNINIYMTSGELTVDGQTFPAGTIVINPNFSGFFGFDIKIHITASQLRDAGITADNINLFHIDGNNKVTFIGTLSANSDGSVDFTINSASYYKLSAAGVVTPMAEIDNSSNTAAIIALSIIAVAVIAGAIIIIVIRKKQSAQA